jgi:hypothetical protein
MAQPWEVPGQDPNAAQQLPPWLQQVLQQQPAMPTLAPQGAAQPPAPVAPVVGPPAEDQAPNPQAVMAGQPPTAMPDLGQAHPAMPQLAGRPDVQPGQPAGAPPNPTIMSRADYDKAHGNAPIPQAPISPFDKIPEGQPGADSWANRHNKLRQGLTLLAAMGAEVGGRDPWGTGGHAGQGQAVLQPWLEAEAGKRQYAANLPQTQEAANQKKYEEYLAGEKEKAGAAEKYGQANYYNQLEGKGIPQGYQIDPVTHQMTPIANQSNLQSSKANQQQSQADLNEASIGLKQAQAQYEKYRTDPNSWMAINAKAHLDLAKAGLNMRMNEYMINNYGHDTEGNVPSGITIGSDGQPIGAKFTKEFTPTTTARDSAGFAQTLQSHIPEFESLIKQLDAEGKLGPLAGRWNDFMAGTVGAGDPEYDTLRTFANLFGTGMMKAHFGNKGGEAAMEHFEGLVNAGKMDAATLLGGIAGYKPFLDEYVKQGTTNTTAGQVVQGHTLPGSNPKTAKPSPSAQAVLDKLLKQ